MVYAAGNGNAACLQALLDAGGDLDQTDSEGETLLMWAAAYGKVDNVALLLARGARLDARDTRGLTALAIATEQKQHEAARVLEQAAASR
jgi:ankyrin repeat protein